MWDPTNWQLEHRTCSDKTGNHTRHVARLRRENRANVVEMPDVVNGVSREVSAMPAIFGDTPSTTGATALGSLPESAASRLVSAGAGLGLPEPAPEWCEPEWAQPLLRRWEADDAFTWPRIMSLPHPAAAGTYGWQAIEWIEARRRADSRVPSTQKALRGFQVLRLVLGLQHDDDGRLLVGTRLESTPRQQGKSVGLSEEALWRTHSGELFGEEQLVMHTAKDLAVAREVQREARLWAQDRGYVVRGTHGAEEIEHDDGSRWMIRGRDSVYSYSAGFAIVDEAWGVDPTVVDDGLEPTLVEREGGQLLLISTAHRRASNLFPERRRAAIRSLGVSGGRTSIAEWSAPPEADPMDPVVWRTATAHWTDKRAGFLLDKAGRPGWLQQWLNVWPGSTDETPLDVWLSKEQMGHGLQVKVNPPPGTVAQVAVELSDTHRCWAVAASWRAVDGSLVLTTDGGHGGLESAIPRIREWCEKWPGGRLWAHLSIVSRLPPGFPAIVVNMKQTDAAAATALFRDLVLERGIRHTGGPLMEQIENVAVRTLDGRELIDQAHSRGPVPAVKAAAWSAWATALAGVEAGAVF
jgi:hypothetical protein